MTLNNLDVSNLPSNMERLQSQISAPRCRVKLQADISVGLCDITTTTERRVAAVELKQGCGGAQSQAMSSETGDTSEHAPAGSSALDNVQESAEAEVGFGPTNTGDSIRGVLPLQPRRWTRAYVLVLVCLRLLGAQVGALEEHRQSRRNGALLSSRAGV